MKVTPALKTELTQWLDNYWTLYLNGDIDTWATFIRDDYRNIGGTKEEIWNSKQEIIDYTRSVMDQMLGTVDIRNRKIELIPYGDYIMVNEFTDLFVKIEEEWSLYGPFRMSSLLEKTDSGWIALHQHGSYPDMKALEGEAFSVDSLKSENAKLQTAVKHRTVELEHKNRELEIETTLERVRAVAMSMKHPADMINVCHIISDQLQLLKVKEIRNVQTAIINDEKGTYLNYEFFTQYKTTSILEIETKLHPLVQEFVNEIKKSADAFFTTSLEGKELKKWRDYRSKTNQNADPILDNASSLHYYFYSIGPGALGLSTYAPLNEEDLNIFKRFRNVFDLAYRRFIDIQQAEAQAREAQIELALERVRAASMAMRDSSALSEIIYKVYVELTKLDAQLDRCFIMIVNPENKGITWWMAGQEGLLAENGFFIPMNQHASHLWYLDCWNSKKKKWQYLLEGKEKTDWDRFGFSKTELVRLPEPVKKFMAAQKKIHLYGSSNQFGSLVTGSFEPLPVEQQDIISRFTIAFNQAYIRFLDLQKAEAQTKEAQIETALERVRSRTMAMHNSQELKEVALELRKQMGLLGQKDLEVCAIHLYDDENSFESWSAMKTPDNEGKILQTQARFPNKGIKIIDELKKQYNSGSRDYIVVNEGEKMVEWFKVMQSNAPDLYVSIMQSVGKLPVNKLKANWSVADFAGGALIMVTYGEPDATSRNLLRRSANVFEQAYIRFLDLQKAEAQAKEAQIEVALERVRSRSLAMHKSEELEEVILVVSEQLQQLQFRFHNVSFGFNNEQMGLNFWLASPDQPKPFLIKVPYIDNPAFNLPLQTRKNGDDFSTDILTKEENQEFMQHIFDNTIWGNLPEENKLYFLNKPGYARSQVLMKNTILTIGNYTPISYTKEQDAILKRFGTVFEQAYTRFLDLQKAEAQAREAQIEAALERVRSRTMAMQKSTELQDVSLLLFQQVQALGIPPFACGFNIWDDDKKAATAWMGSVQGLQPPFKTSSTEDIYLPIFEAAQRGESFFVKEQMGLELEIHYQYLASIPVFRDVIMVNWSKAGVSFPTFQIIHCAFFTNGYLMFITYEPVTESYDIFKRFTKVFEQTYTRFLDLQKAEAQAELARLNLIQIQEEKQRAEEALIELQLTQKQLIQAEKMASLGELTAGIAHEIQNPLNFVNNFSEVSNELIEEIQEERAKNIENRDEELVDEILSDIKQNLEKINHHGKRADAIVKGMLQHSRTSSATKEPTDINKLSDEYLRLAYHGLRAKDKSFNARMKTEFDENIGNINIIPQDIGRVILNLITNAFYAMNEKSHQSIEGYEPTVTVATKKLENTIEISVKDNGNGIPKHIVDKIFQPFFTTKPTGQGTGLGLSLSYDIVKAHDGALKVETEENQGTRFTIHLPL